MSMIYGVFRDEANQWGMTRNKRKAIRCAKAWPGAYVRGLADCPEYHSFDAPTFRVLSDPVWPIAEGS